MNKINSVEQGFPRSWMIVIVYIVVLSLAACGDSGTGDSQQQQSAAPATTDSVTPEAVTTDNAPMPDEDPAMMEKDAKESMEMAGESAADAATKATEVAEAEDVDGRNVYYTYCAVCHKSGLNAAPKFGNKALWAKRIEQGRDVMYKNAIEGIRGMPPRGGIPGLSDAQVKAATDFMVGAAGGWGDS